MHSVEDADPQGHEGFGEVDDLLPLGCDGERSHSQVCLLLEGKQGGGRGVGQGDRQAVREKRTNRALERTAEAERAAKRKDEDRRAWEPVPGPEWHLGPRTGTSLSHICWKRLLRPLPCPAALPILSSSLLWPCFITPPPLTDPQYLPPPLPPRSRRDPDIGVEMLGR